MKLTIDITCDTEHPERWVATCPELEGSATGTTPEYALEALGTAVRAFGQQTRTRLAITSEAAFESLMADAVQP